MTTQISLFKKRRMRPSVATGAHRPLRSLLASAGIPVAIMKAAQILISEPAIIDRLLKHPLVTKHANGSGPDLRLEHRAPATAILPIDEVRGVLRTAHRGVVHRLHHSAHQKPEYYSM